VTADQRHTIRTAIDEQNRAHLAAQHSPMRNADPEYRARRARLLAACATGSVVDRHNQVRSVLRMLDQAAQRSLRV
jgi:hypothetical protein